MRFFLFALLISAFTTYVFCQNVSERRSTTSLAGSSQMKFSKNKKFFHAQSVGQSSVIGSFSNGKATVHQGYLQPAYRVTLVSSNDKNPLNISVFPNPFEALLNLKIEETVTENPMIRIFDLNGKIAFEEEHKKSQHIEINLNDLHSGFYLIEVKMNNLTSRLKIVKK